MLNRVTVIQTNREQNHQIALIRAISKLHKAGKLPGFDPTKNIGQLVSLPMADVPLATKTALDIPNSLVVFDGSSLDSLNGIESNENLIVLSSPLDNPVPRSVNEAREYLQEFV